MEDPIEFVKVEVKEEPMDHQGSSSHFPSSSGVDGVRSRSGDVKEEEVWIKDEPFEEVDPNAVNTTTFTPKPESTRAKDSAQQKSKPHTAEGSTAPLHVTTAALPQETATDQDDSGSDSDEAAELGGESSVGGCTMESGRTSQSVSTKPTSSGVTSTKKRGMKRDRNDSSGSNRIETIDHTHQHLQVITEGGDTPRSPPPQPAAHKCCRTLSNSGEENSSDLREDGDISRCHLCTPPPGPVAHKRRRILSGSGESSSDLSSEKDSDSGSDESSDSSGNSTDADSPRVRTPRACTGAQQGRWSDGQGFVPAVHSFAGTNAGISSACDISEESPYIDYFEKFFSKSVMDTLVTHTNGYFLHKGGYCSDEDCARKLKWRNTTTAEMYVFLAHVMLMAPLKLHNISDYWARDLLTPLTIFGRYMSRDRFQLLMKFLHMSDRHTENGMDPVCKLQPVLTMLKRKFQQSFKPFQKLVIDECFIPHKSRLSFKQHIPSKRHQFDINFFMLCDCDTDMILDFMLYTGKNTEILRNDPLGVSGAVVKQLMQPYLGNGHVLYTDSWYSSPNLCQYLHKHNTGFVGTVRPRRKNMPKLAQGLKRNDLRLHQRDGMLAVQWQDRREINLLTTIHTGGRKYSGKRHQKTGEKIMKPDVLLDYSENMRPVNNANMQLRNIECIRKTQKWYKKVLFHLVEMCVLNAHNLMLVKTGNRPSLKEFCRILVYQLLQRYGNVKPSSGHAVSTQDLPDRLAARDFVSRHHLVDIPPPEMQYGETRRNRKKGQRQCKVCATSDLRPRSRKLVTQMCKECQTPLCSSCFVHYHTQERY